MTDESLLYLSSSDVAQACADVDPLECVADALRRHAAGLARVGVEGVLRWSPREHHAARTLNMPGLLEGAPVIAGTKIINANTGNPEYGLPRADGLTILFDPSNARPRVILQGAAISALRTAAVSTLAAVRLCNDTPATLAVLGAGTIAEAHILLLNKHLDLAQVLIYDCVPQRASALADRLRAANGAIPVTAAGDLEQAVSRASIIVTATTVTSAYVASDWITDGTLVINVSLDDIDAETYLRSDLLYVDDWELITADTQRLLGRLAREGRISGPGEAAPSRGRSVTGTLGELLAGACPGRDKDDQMIVVNPFGMAIEDLAVAEAVCAAAVARGLGTRLPR